MKKAFRFLIGLSLFGLVLVGCSNSNQPSNSSSDESTINDNDQKYQIYLKAKAAGYEGTYEEWLASIRGADGSSLLNGTSDPTPSIGKDGDTYINTSTWDVFVKSGGNWTKVGNILGQKGADGFSLLTGRGEPTSSLGKDGDSYIDLDTWNYYLKENNTWSLQGCIKGKDGENGTDGQDGENGTDGQPGSNGSSVLTGEGVPTSELGTVGDSYIDLSTWDFYVKENSGWTKKGNIKGEDGKDGKDGEDGEDLTNNEYHTVSFDPKGGSEIPSQSILHGEKIQKPTDPTRNGYTFDCWTYQGEKWSFIGYVVTEDMTLEAKWDAIEYTATFVNNDGSILKTVSPVYYGQTIVYDGETPVAANQEAHYSYTFNGWDKDLLITGNVTFTAQYKTEYLPLTAKYYDENNVLLYETNVKEGESPVYVGDLPSKEDDEEFQYQFSDWRIVSEAADEIVFKPVFEKKTNGLVIEGNTVKQYAGVAEEVIIPSKWNNVSITAISSDAFYYNTVAKKVTIPNSMTSISKSAFFHAEVLETVVLPENLIELQSDAFNCCVLLKNISIPASVTTFGDGVFNNCTSLESLTLPEVLGAIPSYAFQTCTSLKEIIIPDSVQQIGKYAFSGCTSLKSVTIGTGVKRIDQYAFKSTGSLPYIVIPSSVEQISGYVFDNDTNLMVFAEPEIRPSSWSELWDDHDISVRWGFKTLKLKDGYLYGLCNVAGNKTSYLLDCIGEFTEFNPENKIDGYTLDGMKFDIFTKDNVKGVTKLIINANVATIPQRAFQSMENITFAALTGKIETIGTYAFLWNNSLRDVVINKTIKKMEWRAFSSCPQLTNVYYLGTQEDWNSITFESENDTIQNANRYYYSETEPGEAGNYWHYINGVPTVW